MSKLKPAVNTNDHVSGKINAPVTLVEYGDFQCPHCGRAHPLIQRLLLTMGNNLRFVFRNFPLREIHENAFIAAAGAEAAEQQGRFWEMHDALFENQVMLSQGFVIELAENLGLNMNVFKRGWRSEETETKIEGDFESGIRSGVNGTPTFFLNGFWLSTYDETFESLSVPIQKIIQEEK